MLDLALIYNRDIRHNGSPAHIWHAFKILEELGEVKVSSYSPHGKLPKHDFYLYLDDGRDDIRWVSPRPSGYWAVDTHLGYEFRRWRAGQVGLTWCAQKAGADKMALEGVPLAKWLPLACNPMAHPTAAELAARDPKAWPVPEVKYDIGFVGFLQPPDTSDRIEFLDEMFKAFPNFTCGFGIFHEDAARLMHQCLVGVNHSIRGDLNMRFFELASMGVAQVCPYMDGLADLGFEDLKHYYGYGHKNNNDSYYRYAEAATRMALEVFGPKVADNAFNLVRSKHTYLHRAQTLVRDILGFLGGP